MLLGFLDFYSILSLNNLQKIKRIDPILHQNRPKKTFGSEMMMDDDWATSGALEKDVFISEIHNEKRTIDIMKLFDDDIDGFSDGRDHINIKMEPNDETSVKWEPCTPPDEKPPGCMLFPPLANIFNQSRHSSTGEDYHGSSSGSPSSSLSSPNEFKDEPLGLDIHFGSALFNGQFSPSATSSHSPTYGMMNGGHSMAPQQHSPLPSVAHFSHNHHLHHHIIQQQQQQPTLQLGMNQVYHSPSPQYNHNPNNLHSFMFKDASIYEGMEHIDSL
ncbi:unnamed protein product [Caenorhabditis brenneri]